MREQLTVGTRIRFRRDLTEGPDEDHPAIIYARGGELGTITGHGTPEGYWVTWDGWPNRFGASEDEFEVVTSILGE